MSTVNAVETEVSFPPQVWMFTLGFVLFLQVRAQLVQQQQQQAAAAVQAAQAQAAQMGASGQVRAQGQCPRSQACGECMLDMSMELGFWWFLMRVWLWSPPDKGDMVFSAVSPLPGVRGRISLPTSLCMLCVPSRCQCCLYWHRNAHEWGGLLWAHYKSGCWYLESLTSSFIKLS